MNIPFLAPPPPPPSFLRTVIALGYFFRVVFDELADQVCLETNWNFGYVLGEIYQKMQ